jgi:hypothetical protein
MSYRPITDIWILARPKVKYYGAYPNGFLERARALLGVTPFDPVLHVCGGRAREYPAKPRGFGPNDRTLDLDASLEPDFLRDAREPLPCPRHHGASQDCLQHPQYQDACGWHAVMIDRPYTEQDATHYAPGADKLPAINLLLKNGLAAVRAGGRVGVIDYLLPQPPKNGVRFVACVGVIAGYNNRMRVFSVFEKECAPHTTGEAA